MEEANQGMETATVSCQPQAATLTQPSTRPAKVFTAGKHDEFHLRMRPLRWREGGNGGLGGTEETGRVSEREGNAPVCGNECGIAFLSFSSNGMDTCYRSEMT